MAEVSSQVVQVLVFNSTRLSKANADNFTVKNADIGIDAVNANPSVWNYVLEDNEVGLNVVNNRHLHHHRHCAYWVDLVSTMVDIGDRL